ncbi:unnamed protein product [Clavelina lepadiformis]|uniref:Uncharacterized protein n=1 Tax=Clavelina lepadiformis TaxID=159417 RepID=A0ABP0GUU9_CLALP
MKLIVDILYLHEYLPKLAKTRYTVDQVADEITDDESYDIDSSDDEHQNDDDDSSDGSVMLMIVAEGIGFAVVLFFFASNLMLEIIRKLLNLEI